MSMGWLWVKFVFVEIVLCTLHRWTLGEKLPVWSRKVFCRVVRTRILPIHRIVLKRSFFNGKKFPFRHFTLTEYFWAFCLKSSARLSKLPFTCPQDLLKELFSLKWFIFFKGWGHWAKDCRSFVEKVGSS